MPTENNEDRDFPTEQISGAIPENTAETDENEEATSENLSEVAMRINLLGKLVIPPPAP